VKILVVDDDLDLRGLVAFALQQAGYLVLEAGNGLDGLALFEREQPDLVVLDVNMPRLDGFETCRRIRAASRTPVMMLTVRGSEEDQVRGLDLGADDFLVKPFSPRTLLARVRALLRRAEPAHEPTLTAGRVALDPARLEVRVGEADAVHLTPLEFRLLQFLAASAGHPVASERLARHVWGYEGIGDRQRLKQLVHRVRTKIESNPAEARLLVTVPGVGYALQVE
jgi:DNA-binding response OmpR family regulator